MSGDYWCQYRNAQRKANKLEAELNAALDKLKAKEEEAAKEEEKKAEEKKPANIVRKMLGESKTGNEALNALDESGYSIEFDHLGSISSSIYPQEKKVVLNSNASYESGALSAVYAARLLKQEANGVDMSAESMAVRKADALLAQTLFADEMSEKNPKILETFIAKGNGPMYETFKEKQRAAFSACVDLFLDNVMPDNKPSAEKIAGICRTANGQSYYGDGKLPKAAEVVGNVYNEPSFNTVFAAKMKQGGR